VTALMERNDRLIRTSLLGNAAFSAVSGVVAAAAAGRLADATELPSIVVRAVGLGLLAYAAMLWMWARRTTFRPIEGRIAVLADLAWVGGTIVLLAVAPDVTNGVGSTILIAVAVIVACFAEAQYVGLRRLAT